MEFVCQFDVREILGQGSFCEVKRCIDKRTRQAFAVKEMIYDTDELRERIEQEIEVSVSPLVQFMVCMSLVYFKKLRRHTAKISKSKRRLYEVWRIKLSAEIEVSQFFEHVYMPCLLLRHQNSLMHSLFQCSQSTVWTNKRELFTDTFTRSTLVCLIFVITLINHGIIYKLQQRSLKIFQWQLKPLNCTPGIVRVHHSAAKSQRYNKLTLTKEFHKAA